MSGFDLVGRSFDLMLRPSANQNLPEASPQISLTFSHTTVFKTLSIHIYLSHTRICTHTHSFILNDTQSILFFLNDTHSHTQSLFFNTHTLSLSFFFSLSLTYILSTSCSFSATHTHSLVLSQKRKHSLSHSFSTAFTRTLILSQRQSYSFSFFRNDIQFLTLSLSLILSL